MIKVVNINGVRRQLNTNTSDKVNTAKNGRGAFHRVEILYRTSRGEHFIHGTGGSLTRWNGREDLVLLSDKALKHWKKKQGIK